MKTIKNRSAFMFFLLATCLLVGSADANGSCPERQEIAILHVWCGDYPVSEFHRFPESQRSSPIVYLKNEEAFSKIWQAFKPAQQLPCIDFRDHLVFFSRNVNFYNRIGIVKVLLSGGVAEIVTVETRSAFPIEDKVGMTIAVIPRAGVKYINAGKERIPVTADAQGSVPDPLNATYILAGQEITLQNGRSEKAVAPGSATKIRTSVLGDLIKGDLDGDGDEDAALILVHDPGGSGTFYYVAVAENLNGRIRGTNGVRLGDRITPMDLQIRKTVVIATYAARGSCEPMSKAPSVTAWVTLALNEGKLKVLKPLGTNEQIVEGRVMIGHEVRSFHPCTQKTEYWLSGESPALKEIIARYRKALPNGRPYTQLFMVLAGKFVEAPREGYGADYVGAFLATQLVGVRPKGNCSMKLKEKR